MYLNKFGIGLVHGGVLLCHALDSDFSYIHQTQKLLNVPNDTPINPFDKHVATFVADVMDRWKIPGMAIGVIDGEHVFTKGYGFSTLPSTKVTGDTLFLGGSTSKAFVAATLAQMIDSKNYTALSRGWMTPISSIIRDDFVMRDQRYTSEITLDDAVSHRTGLPRHDLAWGHYSTDGSKITVADTVQKLRFLSPNAPLRTTWQYCNLMYVVLGHVIETLTGKRLDEAMREIIWEPLGMNATFGETQDAIIAPEDMATGYFWDRSNNAYKTMPRVSVREFGGAGAVISTVADYTKWIKCLLDETLPFSEATHKDIQKPRVLTSVEESTGDGDMTYGLGWMKKTHHGQVVYKHAGTHLAYSTQVYWIPKLKYGVVAMANTAYANSAEDDVVWRLIEDRLGVPEDNQYNISSSLGEYLDGLDKMNDESEHIFYPAKPEKPLPSSLSSSQIVGKYFDPGYGYLEFFAAQIDGESKLLANRSNMMIPHMTELRHVTGNYWLLDIYWAEQNLNAGQWGVEFKVGVDGTVASLELQLGPPDQEFDEGTVTLQRMS